MTYVCTIFADASLDDKTKIAAWGAWMKGNGKVAIVHGGAFQLPMPSSTSAEFHAIANALAVARACGYLALGKVMIQCDNTVALGMLHVAIPGTLDAPMAGGRIASIPKKQRTLAHYRKGLSAPIKVIRGIVDEFSLALVTRHVPGHTEGDGRQWVNRKVDAVAKRAMRKARRKANVDV